MAPLVCQAALQHVPRVRLQALKFTERSYAVLVSASLVRIACRMASSPIRPAITTLPLGQQDFHVALFRRGATHAQQNIAELGDMTQMAPSARRCRSSVPARRAPDAVFLFKHALVQDAAYITLLRGPRQALHAQIAQALETHSPELMDSQPELFAQHYAEAM